MRFLLDSTLLIDHANADEPASVLLGRLFAEGHELYTCDVVTCEVLSGGDEPNRMHIQHLLDAMEYVATSPEAARWAGRSRLAGHRAGARRALADALIAGVAWHLQATIVTRNRPDFERQGIPVLTY
ncbi:MAG TPA: type II toxin-antitoxin system VapC family toxin [Candidatus Limnocylindria bacterium]|nr:type II toxin-antitoxin system VapC family toxin [Candidatus Limnocylindria bacterium]